MNIRLSKAELKKIANGQALYEVLQKVLARENIVDRGKEHLWIAGLDNKQHLQLLELVSLGNNWRTTADPMAIFSFSLQKGCKQIIMAHNHPSGMLEPSESDLKATEVILTVGKFLKCPLYDSMIISETGYYSFREQGIIKKMSRVNDLLLTYEQIKMMNKAMEVKNEQIALLKKELLEALKKSKK